MLEPIRRVLRSTLSKKGLSAKLDAALIIEKFRSLLEKDFGAHGLSQIKNISLRGRALNVSSDSSSFKQAVSFKERTYLHQLEQSFGSKAVTKITYFG